MVSVKDRVESAVLNNCRCSVYKKKVFIHTASHIQLRLGLGLASQASCVYLRGMCVHTATGEANRVYSISLLKSNS